MAINRFYKRLLLPNLPNDFLLRYFEYFYNVRGRSWFSLYDYNGSLLFLEHAVDLGKMIIQCKNRKVVFNGIFRYGKIFGAFKMRLGNACNFKSPIK